MRLVARKPTKRATVRFVDTNVLLYAALRDDGERGKAARAKEILWATDLALSVQVLQEFYYQATRESRPGSITHEQATSLIDTYRGFPVQDITVDLLLAATETARRFQISYWDAAIIAAARTLGCEIVLSEDLSDGQDYGGVRVENPFAGS